MFSLYANHIKARATPSRISQLLCLDYYEMSFLEVIKLAALMQEKRVELMDPFCMLRQPNLSCWDHRLETHYSRPALGTESVRFCHYIIPT